MLEYVKRQLGYTWADTEMAQRIRDLIEQGQYYLSRFDPEIDWKEPTPFQKGLLVDYCRYSISNASDDFPVNYRAELMTLHHDYIGRHVEDENADNVQTEQG